MVARVRKALNISEPLRLTWPGTFWLTRCLDFVGSPYRVVTAHEPLSVDRDVTAFQRSMREARGWRLARSHETHERTTATLVEADGWRVELGERIGIVPVQPGLPQPVLPSARERHRHGHLPDSARARGLVDCFARVSGRPPRSRVRHACDAPSPSASSAGTTSSSITARTASR